MTDTDPDFEWADSLAEVKLLNPRLRGEENLLRAYKLLRSREENLLTSIEAGVENFAIHMAELQAREKDLLTSIGTDIKACKLYVDELRAKVSNQESNILQAFKRWFEEKQQCARDDCTKSLEAADITKFHHEFEVMGEMLLDLDDGSWRRYLKDDER